MEIGVSAGVKLVLYQISFQLAFDKICLLSIERVLLDKVEE
jgi:hypothetical protein